MQTWIRGGGGGSAAEGAGVGGVASPLVKTVDGIRSVRWQGVRQIAEARRLYGGAVGAGAASEVESSLHNLFARVAPHHAPRGCRGGDGGGD